MLTKNSVVFKPFQYPYAIELANESEGMHWQGKEADLQKDINDWQTQKLDAVERNHITQILRLFTQSDVAVGGNYCDAFIPVYKNNEIRNMLLSFANREGEHQRSYALLNDTLGFPDTEYSAFLGYKAMAEKIDFMTQYDVSTDAGRVLTVAKAIINEGMSLFGAFAMLLQYQRKGKMIGMCEIVEWSIKDESLHVKGLVFLYHTDIEENPHVVTDDFKKQVYEMVRNAVKLEDKFIDLAYEMGSQDGALTKEVMKQYIRYIADRRLLQLGMKPNYYVKECPIEWLDWVVAGDSFKNFFEGKVTDYNKAGLSGESWGYPVIDSVGSNIVETEIAGEIVNGTL